MVHERLSLRLLEGGTTHMRGEQGGREAEETFKYSTERHWCKQEEKPLLTGAGCVWELTHRADFLEVSAALHVVLAVIITVAAMLSRIPFPTSPCTAP